MFILWAVFSAVLAYEIVYSDLAHWFMKVLFLDKEYLQITLLKSPKAHYKLLGKWLTFPPITLASISVLLLLNLHQFLYYLFQCPYCTAFWIAVITAYTVGLPTHLIVTLPFVSMLITGVYNKLRN